MAASGIGAAHPDLYTWQVDVAQLLEEHHLVAWSPVERDRLLFGVELAAYLRGLTDSEVWFIHGQHVTDLDSFCTQVERILGAPAGDVARRIHGAGGVVDALRQRRTTPGHPAKTRYYIWQDASTLLRSDHRLFGQLVDAVAGVAAEAEYASEDLLLIHRGVFIGAPALDAYAEDPRGQFQTWACEEDERALWEVVSGLSAPPVLRYRIGAVAAEEPIVRPVWRRPVTA